MLVIMSARNYLSAREKSVGKLDCLPSINQQKFGYRSSGQELPPVSANTSGVLNRNLNYSFDIQSYRINTGDRTGTPFSDFSESETGTPDFRSEESDSSAGSALRRNTAETSKILRDEWERIERTIYDEDGEKTTRPQILEECQQWKALHPQLRVVGKAIPLPEKKVNYRPIEYDEVIALHYSDYEDFSESEDRLSNSSTDVTPQNSPRSSREIISISEGIEPKLTREKVSFYPFHDEIELPETFSSLLQITPVQIRSPSHRKRQNQSILRSEIASSRWMKNTRPDSSLNFDRNSAKSFVSLDIRNQGNLALSASERNKMLNNRILTARHRDVTRLEPLGTPDSIQNETVRIVNGLSHQYSLRKVSLPPLLLEEERKKIVTTGSGKKYNKARKNSKSMHHLERMKHNINN